MPPSSKALIDTGPLSGQGNSLNQDLQDKGSSRG